MIKRKDLLSVGEFAPDFTAQSSCGAPVVLSAFRGRKSVLLIFYPGDFTPVCTSQLCGVMKQSREFDDAGVTVLGINPLSQWIHEQFAARKGLTFPLLYDKRGEICAAYGCLTTFGMVKRTVYLVDKQGRVAFAERGTPPLEHILRIARNLGDEA